MTWLMLDNITFILNTENYIFKNDRLIYNLIYIYISFMIFNKLLLKSKCKPI